MHPQIPIDTHFLLKKIRGLVHVEKNLQTWNEFGESVVMRKGLTRPRTGRCIIDTFKLAEPTSTSIWHHAKKLVHSLFTGQNPDHDELRNRLGNSPNPPTPLLLSTVSLWLAGELKIIISVTRSMVATMLYAVGKSSGDWDILARS